MRACFLALSTLRSHARRSLHLCRRVAVRLEARGRRALAASLLHSLPPGRDARVARKPHCGRCPLNEVCPAHEREPEGPWTKRAAHEADFVASKGAVTGPEGSR